LAAIGDSSAFKSDGRVLPQHQAALTLLQGRLSMPGVERLVWLDLACGRGQILMGLDESLSLEARQKLEYWAYDVDQDYARETSKLAEGLGLGRTEASVGDLDDFDSIVSDEVRFDYITLTNSLHELAPSHIADLMLNAIRRLSDDGIVFIYDMERIAPPELGALPWTGSDMRTITLGLLESLGVSDYRPEVGRWRHSSVNGWSVQIHRGHLGISGEQLAQRSDEAIQQTRDQIVALLNRRMRECRASLETLTAYGAQTAQEQGAKEHLLYEFWALSRALEGHG
jgi:ubiquinone/menaquinone biosynthesis C-methylase UbiE